MTDRCDEGQVQDLESCIERLEDEINALKNQRDEALRTPGWQSVARLAMENAQLSAKIAEFKATLIKVLKQWDSVTYAQWPALAHEIDALLM